MFPSLISKESNESFKCHVCQLAKHHRATYPPSNTKTESNSSISSAKWLVTFIDDCTHVKWIFLMKEKSKDLEYPIITTSNY